MFVQRQVRWRVLDALERRAKAFRTDEDLYPLRVPREPLTLQDVVDEALADLDGRLDPLDLRQRTLLHFRWDDGSEWEVWVMVLPSGLKLFCDSGAEEPRVLASGGRHASDETDRQFLRLFCESAGERFGVEMAGGAPARVRCAIRDRGFLADVFVELFEVTRAESSVRAQIADQPVDAVDAVGGHDFRSDVERWLALALS